MGTNSQFFKEIPVSVLNQVQFPSRPSPFLHREFHGSSAPIQTGSSRPHFGGSADVLPYSASTRTSAGASTAWRLPRDANDLPHPYSKNTSGSTYSFDA